MKGLLKTFGLNEVWGLDFETYYDDEYSLRKMATTEYICDPRFESQMLSIQRHSWAKPKVLVGAKDIAAWAKTVDWSKAGFLAHHAHFDGLIASRYFGIHPKMYFDTLSMARPIMPVHVGGSLQAVTTSFGLKGKVRAQALANVKGKRLSDFTKKEIKELALYAGDDIDLTWQIFHKMRGHLTDRELQLIDLTVKLYARPTLMLDGPALQQYADEEVARKEKLLADIGADRKQLMSNDQFAELLRSNGVEPPMKVSKTTGRETYAFAKNDLEFTALLDHDDEVISTLVEARLGVKSTINETRAQRMANRAAFGPTPIYLNYWGAKCVPGDTEVLTRAGWKRLDSWDGGDIAQYTLDGELVFEHAERFVGPTDAEWVRVDAPYFKCDLTFGHTVPYIAHGTKRLRLMHAHDLLNRRAVRIPVGGMLRGHGALDADQMRVLVMVQADGTFETDTKQGRRLAISVKKSRKIERTRAILVAANIPFTEHVFESQPGYVRFVVRAKDYPQWLTPDRKLFGAWLLDSTEDARRAFVEEIEHWDGCREYADPVYYSTDKQNAEWVQTLAHLVGLSAGVSVRPATETRKSCFRVILRSRGYTDVKPSHVTVCSVPRTTYCTMTRHGMWLARANGHIFVTGNTGRWSGGDSANWQNLSRGSPLRKAVMAPKGHSLVIADLSQIEARMNAWFSGQDDMTQMFTDGIDVYCAKGSEVFGRTITKADQRERFISKVMVLMLQYGAGSGRFYENLRTNKVDITEAQADSFVRSYRSTIPFITANWKATWNHIRSAFLGQQRIDHKVLSYAGFEGRGVTYLPDGTYIRYDKLEADEEGMSYATKWRRLQNGEVSEQRQRLYGGLCVENNIQALARSVIAEHTVNIVDALPNAKLVMSTHDEVVLVVPNRSANKVLRTVTEIMSQPPSWGHDLPVAVEAHISERYDK